MDDNWFDNVKPLLQALEIAGVDPVEWAETCDYNVFERIQPKQDGEGNWDTEALMNFTKVMGMVDFACGYMQATGNLTGRSWAEQIKDHLAKAEKEKS